MSYEEGDIKKALKGDKSNKNKKSKKIKYNMLIKETSIEQEKRVRKQSPFGSLKSWRLFRLIVKSNDDVR